MLRPLAVVALAFVSSLAGAHDIRPMRLQLDEISPGEILVQFKLPVLKDVGMPAAVAVFPSECKNNDPLPPRHGEESVVQSWHMSCPGGLAGQTVTVHGFSVMTPDVLVTARFADGRETHSVLTQAGPQTQLTATDNGDTTGLGAYLPLGIAHILGGIDHLFFVLGLLLVIWRIGAGPRQVLLTVTAFTLAHSVTLAGSILRGWSLPGATVETLIALSILLLAVEVARSRRIVDPPVGLSFRSPWLVAFGFGLLHGFGFADALRETGLPEAARGWALLLFNLGVEAGQLLFVTLLLSGWLLLRRYLPRLQSLSITAATWLLGSLSAAWVLDRAAPIFLS